MIQHAKVIRHRLFSKLISAQNAALPFPSAHRRSIACRRRGEIPLKLVYERTVFDHGHEYGDELATAAA
jgi:hypothetical protein